MKLRNLLLGLMLLGAIGLPAAPAAARSEMLTLHLTGGTEVNVRRFPAAGDALLLWFPCDEGQGTAEARAAAELQGMGIETWLPDMLGAHFLPMAPSSMDKLPPEEIAALVDAALETGKRVYLVTAGRGAVPVLRGFALWRRNRAGSAPEGLILFYPELYAGTPTPGTEAQYEPVVRETQSRIVILQGERSPGRWWLRHLAQALESGGSRVHTRLLPGVRGYFFVREEQTPEEAAMAARLPQLVVEAMDEIEAIKRETR